jgi:hypothetical protein
VTDLADKHVRLASYIVGEEIVRRRRFGHPIPQALRELDAALSRALCAAAQPETPVVKGLKTTTELAREWRCSAMTVRRRAAAAGARKLGNQWIFDQEQT